MSVAEDAAVRVSLKKLQSLQAACGVKKALDPNAIGDAEIDYSKMTPYDAAQFKIADRMRIMRGLVSELDALPSGGNPTRRVEISNQIRKEDKKVKTAITEARQLATQEQKQREYETLQMHYRTTTQLWKSRFGGNTASEESTSNSYYGSVSKDSGIELDNALPSSSGYSLREDEEFLQFFQQTQRNDKLMDQAFDRIHQGVQRLGEQALMLKQEMKVQDILLDEVEKKTDGVTAKLKGLNSKLKDTIKKVDQDKMCVYVFCFILLLGIAGAIYFVISGDGKK